MRLQKEIGEQARKNRGIELPGSANQLLVGNLFRDQSKPWEGIARLHLLNTWESVKYFVYLLLRHLTDEPTYTLLVGTVLAPQLERMKDGLLNKLGELTAYTKRGHPLPIGKSFLSKIQVARTNRQIAALRKGLGLSRPFFVLKDGSESFDADDLERAASELRSSSDQFAAAEIIDQMQAYYDTSIVTFVDNIATLAIENCLLGPLERIFTSQTVNNMDDQQIRELAEELPHVQHDRQRLDQELNKLQAGLDTFNIFSTESSSLQRPSIFAKPASRHSSLSQSLDPIAIRKKTKPQSKSQSVPTTNSPSPSVASGDNRNSNTTTASTRNVNPAFGTPTSISTSLLFSRSSSSGDSSNANNPSKEKLPFNSLGSHTWNTPRPSDGLFGPLPFSNVETAKSSAEIGQGLFLAPRFGQSSGSSSIFGSTDTTAKYDPKEPPATEGLNR